MNRLAFLIIGLFCVAFSKAQDTLRIDEAGKEFADLTSFIRVIQDPSGQWSYHDVLVAGDSLFFNPWENKIEQESNAYWAKLNVVCQSENDEHRWVHWNAFSGRYLNNLEAYVLEGGELQHQVKFGYYVPESQLEGAIDWDTFSFHFKEKTSYTLLFRIHNPSRQAPSFNIQVLQPALKVNRKDTSDQINLFVEGMVWVMILYYILLFFSSKDRVYIYFSFYLITFSLYDIFNLRYSLILVLRESPYLNPIFTLSFFGLNVVFFWLLMQKGFRVRITLPVPWRIWVKSFISVKSTLVLLLFFYTYFMGYDVIFQQVIVGLIPVEMIFSLIFVLRLRELKFKIYIFIISGIIGFGVFFSIAYVMYLLKIPEAHYFGKAAVLFEMLAFAFGLGYRSRLKEQEKRTAQEEHINQLQKNEEQLQNHRQELEKKVADRTSEIQSQQEEIEHQNERLTETFDRLNKSYGQIRDSINYAGRIQEAVLPRDEELEDVFSSYFIYYRPRDIVSGDFYWVKKIKDKYLIAAVDCTGHGVPGAFLSLLGITFLNEICSDLSISDDKIIASDILDRLRKKVKDALRQNFLENHAAREAMDVALCVVDESKSSMQFAGAHNPLYLIQKGELIEYKGDRMPISFQRKEVRFTNHEIKLNAGDRCYLFSDGYVDQFGGKHGDKLKTKRFKYSLLDMLSDEMHFQGTLIDKKFNDWRGDRRQIDDVLVIGFEI